MLNSSADRKGTVKRKETTRLRFLLQRIFLLSVVSVISFGSDLVPREQIMGVANNILQQRDNLFLLQEILTYYGLDEQPNAYALVYRNNQGEPFTIVVGARYTCTPVSEFSKSLPNSYRMLERARARAREALGAEPKAGRIYYFGPQEEYFCFEAHGRQILINTHSLEVLNKADLSALEPERSAQLETALRKKWGNYVEGPEFIARDTAYIDSVPFVLWTYGCSPTAAAMLLWYWDSRGYGRLVDYFFDRWDAHQNEWDFNIPNVTREMAVAMYTDTMTGGSNGIYYVSAFLNVCNTINGYSYDAVRHSPGNAGNQYLFSYIRNEIDSQRPFLWVVHNHYPQVWQGGHALTGIGYDIALPDTFVIVHNTWDYTEPHWALWTYYNGVYSDDDVYGITPGDPEMNNVSLTFPKNGGRMFQNLKYYLRWESLGGEIDHLKMWYSIGRQASNYDSLNWVLIDPDLPDTGRYLWTVPAEDSAFRINIAGLSSTNTRLAADGSFKRVIRDTVEHSAGVNLVGHYDTGGSCLDAVRVGEYLYVADFSDGLLIFDAMDSSVLDLVGRVADIGSPGALFYNAPYIYLADQTCTLRIFDLANPALPHQIGHVGIAATPLRVFVQGSYAYLSCLTAGMLIVNCIDPSNPFVAGTFDSPGQVRDIYVSGTIAYVADGTAGLRIVDIGVPTSPVELNHYDPTPGIIQGVEKNGNYLYLADGSIGLRILHLTAPAYVESLSVYDTPGIAKCVRSGGNLVYVADGPQGVRIIDVTDPQVPLEAGCLLANSAGTLSVIDNLIYLADGTDGVYVILHDLTHVRECGKPGFTGIILRCSSVINAAHGMRFKVQMPERGHVEIKLHDIAGRLVDVIYTGMIDCGVSEFSYGGRLSAGVYFLSLDDSMGSLFQKLLFVK
jgi:hypothetical protein